MTTATESHTEHTIEVAGLALRYLKGGAGTPVVVLHHSTGNPGWIPFYERLAERASVYVPDLPGYGQSARRGVGARAARSGDPDPAGPSRARAQEPDLVGLGFGGFMAAEMATMCGRVGRLVLVGAAGLQPREGEIMDEMMVGFNEYVMAGFRDKDGLRKAFGDDARRTFKELWDYSREMTARLCWKPYMFSRRLPRCCAGCAPPPSSSTAPRTRSFPIDWPGSTRKGCRTPGWKWCRAAGTWWNTKSRSRRERIAALPCEG